MMQLHVGRVCRHMYTHWRTKRCPGTLKIEPGSRPAAYYRKHSGRCVCCVDNFIKMPPPVGLLLRLSVGMYWMCFFVCCVCWFFGVLKHHSTSTLALRFAVSRVLALALTHDAKHMGHTLTTVHSKQTILSIWYSLA